MNYEIANGRTVHCFTRELYFERMECEGAGFSFPCDEAGNVETENLHPQGLASYKHCMANPEDFRTPVVQDFKCGQYTLCACGSGKENYQDFDARGISIGMVCSDCAKANRSKYRADVLTDSNYWADEALYEEEY